MSSKLAHLASVPAASEAVQGRRIPWSKPMEKEPLRIADRPQRGPERKESMRSDEAAWDLLMDNLPLVQEIINQHRLNRIPNTEREDVWQILMCEMFRCAQLWDPEKGALSTYLFGSAPHCVNAVRANASRIHFPARLMTDINQYLRWNTETGSSDPAGFAKFKEIPLKKAERIARKARLYRCSMLPVREDQLPVSSGAGHDEDNCSGGRPNQVPFRSLEPETVDKLAATADEDIMFSELRKDMAESLKFLQPKHRLVISMRYGLDDTPEATLQEIGDMLHMTREAVRKIEAAALRRMRVGKSLIRLRAHLDEPDRHPALPRA